MFSTFTGNSRRPRNVNLSGQTGNPFTNTSWSPSLVSNATKTVSNAQADRERRQADKQRLKAAGQIQRIWRGYRTRRLLGNDRRANFDGLCLAVPAQGGGLSIPSEKLALASSLLVSFFSTREIEDIQRLITFSKAAAGVEVSQLTLPESHPSRILQLLRVLVSALPSLAKKGSPTDVFQAIDLILRVTASRPDALSVLQQGYFEGLAELCRATGSTEESNGLIHAIAGPLQLASQHSSSSVLYEALAYQLLAKEQLPLLNTSIPMLAEIIDLRRLSEFINEEKNRTFKSQIAADEAIWLVARFIHLAQNSPGSSKHLGYLGALYKQLTTLSVEIGLRMGVTEEPELTESKASKARARHPLDPYVSGKLLALIETDGIASILRDFSAYLAVANDEGFQGTSILAGLFLTLMTCFPAQADGARMKLFLEQVPTPHGNIPLVQIMWRTMSQTATFEKLAKGQNHTTEVLRNYVLGNPATTAADEQDWRVILLFLELYTFILRLSDDEEFLSGLSTDLFQTTSTSGSRIQACSLGIEQVKKLTTVLKHTAFALHSNGPETFQAQARLQGKRVTDGSGRSYTSAGSTNDLGSLKNIVTAALKMLYERDSRLHFLPPDFWLMVDKFDKEGFMNAVVEEEMAQREAEAHDDSDSDASADDEDAGLYFRARSSMLRGWKADHKERRLAEMGPKLEVLKHMPFVVPFETRVRIFRKFIQMDRNSRDESSFSFLDHQAKHHAQIRRGKLFEDAYNAFFKVGDGLKDLISITFIDRFGAPEAGIDGGGVTKEFLTSVIAEAFGAGDEDLQMFTTNSAGLVYPNPTALDVLREQMRKRGVQEGSAIWNDAINELLKRYEFLGRIFGKCMYEGILVDVAFAGFFLLKWPSPSRNEPNSYKGSVNDLRDMDEELYRGLLRLKNHEGDVSELGIDFTIADQVSRPDEPSKTITRNLIPNGDQILVTNDNRLLYNSYVARHRLVLQPALQTQAFLRGLRLMIKPSWLSMFNQSELQRLEGGDSSEIDIDDLRQNTIYSGLYVIGDDGEEHPTIKLFWKVMSEFTDAQRRDVIKYVSSTPRAPLLGFSQLSPKFSIRDSGHDQDRLPSTSTCVNLLKLPMYETESRLREKLLYAVTSGAGFDLS